MVHLIMKEVIRELVIAHGPEDTNGVSEKVYYNTCLLIRDFISHEARDAFSHIVQESNNRFRIRGGESAGQTMVEWLNKWIGGVTAAVDGR